MSSARFCGDVQFNVYTIIEDTHEGLGGGSGDPLGPMMTMVKVCELAGRFMISATVAESRAVTSVSPHRKAQGN